jgi:hypothetical protein
MEDMNEERKCELCQEKATILCFDCSFYLCGICSKFLHDKKANQEHKKEDIDPFVSIDIKCSIHPKYHMNLFCVNEKSKKIDI